MPETFFVLQSYLGFRISSVIGRSRFCEYPILNISRVKSPPSYGGTRAFSGIKFSTRVARCRFGNI